jgi:hypothetical protein
LDVVVPNRGLSVLALYPGVQALWRYLEQRVPVAVLPEVIRPVHLEDVLSGSPLQHLRHGLGVFFRVLPLEPSEQFFHPLLQKSVHLVDGLARQDVVFWSPLN